MKLTVEGNQYELDLTKIKTKEAIALQKATGLTLKQFFDAIGEMDAVALTGLVWLAFKRAGNKMAFDDVDVDLMSLDIDTEGDEVPEGKAKTP